MTTVATLPEVNQVSPKTISFAVDPTPDGFCNPRHFHQKEGEGLLAQGLEDPSMQQLCTDIDRRGITNPLICRKWSGSDTIQLLAGERRLRCALNLELESIPCRIYEDISDEEAWSIAWHDNDTGKQIGDNASAALVKHWRSIGYADDKILEITGRTKPWLRQMDTLGALDLRTFDEYQNGRLSLRVALKLAAVGNIELRHALLDATLADLEKDWKEEIAKREKAVHKAEDKVETAQANVTAAALMGDDADKQEAQEEAAQAQQNLNQAQSNLSDAEGTTPQARNKNLNAASKTVGAQHVSSSLSKAKMKKILKSLDEWVENEGHDDENDFVAEVNDLLLARNIVNSILTGGGEEPIALIKQVFADFYVEDDEAEAEDDEAEAEDDEAEAEDDEAEAEDEDDEAESVENVISEYSDDYEEDSLDDDEYDGDEEEYDDYEYEDEDED